MNRAIEKLNSFSLLDLLLFIKKKAFAALICGVVVAFSSGLITLLKGETLGTIGSTKVQGELFIYPTHIVNYSLSRSLPFKNGGLFSLLVNSVSGLPAEVLKYDGDMYLLKVVATSPEEVEQQIALAKERIQKVFDKREAPLIATHNENLTYKESHPNWRMPYVDLVLASFDDNVTYTNFVASSTSRFSAPAFFVLMLFAGVFLAYALFGLWELIKLLNLYESELEQQS